MHTLIHTHIHVYTHMVQQKNCFLQDMDFFLFTFPYKTVLVSVSDYYFIGIQEDSFG